MYILRPGIDRCPCCGSIIPEGIERERLLILTIIKNDLDAQSGAISLKDAYRWNYDLFDELESEE